MFVESTDKPSWTGTFPFVETIVLAAVPCQWQTWSLTKILMKKLEISQWGMERKMIHVKLRDSIRNTIIGHKTSSDRHCCLPHAKRKWTGHIARVSVNRRTIRSTKWQIKGVRSLSRPTRCWRWQCRVVGNVLTTTAMDRESWRTVAEGFFLPLKDEVYISDSFTFWHQFQWSWALFEVTMARKNVTFQFNILRTSQLIEIQFGVLSDRNGLINPRPVTFFTKILRGYYLKRWFCSKQQKGQ